MFNRLLAILLLLTSPAFAQTTAQSGARVNNGAILNVAPNSPINVSVSPSTASLTVGNTQNFTATISNDLLNAGVNWTISGSGCSTVNDNFPIGDSNPIGSPWVNLPGAPAQLLNHQFTGIPGAVGGSGATFDGGITWSHDQFSQATLVAFPNSNGFAGLELDRGATESYQLGITTIGTPGGFSQPSTVLFIRAGITLASFHIVPKPNDILTAGITGQVLSFFQNGVLIGSFTDPGSVIATGRPGLDASINSGPAGAVAWNTWSAGSNATGCGNILPSFSRSGQSVTYTAPPTLPPNSSITITATSVQDPSKFASAVVALSPSGTVPSGTVNVFNTTIPKQTGAAANTFPVPTGNVGDTTVITIGAKDGSNITSVLDNLGNSFTDSGCQGDQLNSGHTAIFYRVGVVTNNINSITVNSTGTTGGTVDIGYLVATLGNSNQPDVSAVCGGSTTPTTNPVGPSLTTLTPGDLVVSTISVGGDALSAKSPFVFGAMARGDGSAYAIATTTGVYSPSWTTSNFGWAGTTVAFRAGTSPPQIGITIVPTSSTVQTNAYQQFTVNIVNDNTNAGATLSRAGGGCAGATCGNVTYSNVNHVTNLTGSSAAPTVVLGGLNTVGNVLLLTGRASSNLMSYGAPTDSNNNTWSVATSSVDATGGTYNAILWTPNPVKSGVTTINVPVTNPTLSADFFLYDLTLSPGTWTIQVNNLSNQVATTNPVGPTINPTGAGIVITAITPATGNPSAIAAPFTQHGFSAVDINAGVGALNPNWTTTNGTWAASILSIVPNTTVKSGGTFTYQGPASVPSPALVTLTATSVADGSKTGTAAVTVSGVGVLSVGVSPSSITVPAGGGAQNATATVTNDIGAAGVTWALTGANCSGANCGTISATSGATITYTPPAMVSANLPVSLIATSVADNTKSGTIFISVTTPVTPPSGCGGSGCPAFPGAQGGGALSSGGRGGTVFEVTNFNNSGTGSLSACVSATGPRRCIFRVAGIFPGGLFAANPFLDIDGQSAPGEVILGGPTTPADVLRISTHDVVLRYLTVSPDNRNVLSGPQGGTSGLVIINCAAINNQRGTGGCYNVIADHITARWAGNKNIAVFSNFTPGAPDCQVACNGPNHNITLSWFLQYEPHAGHPVGIGNGTDESGTASTTQLGFETEQDWHHGLLANTSHRIPEGPMMRNRWQDMIVFNWSAFAMASLGTQFLDMINNKYVAGNLNSLGPANAKPIHISNCGSPPGSAQNAIDCSIVPSVYLSGNIGVGATTPATDQFSLADQIVCENCDGVGPVPANWRRTTPISTALKFPITADPAVNLDTIILPTVGNSQHLDCLGNWVSHRDAADARIVAQYQNNTSGGFWPNATYPPIVNQTSPNQIPVPTTNWTDIPITNFPVCTESQHDGIPDAWKIKFGLSTSDATLGNKIDTNTGFTYAEDYLGGIAP